MKVEKQAKKPSDFADLDVGECFTHCDRVYIKIEELFDEYGEDRGCYNAINLETGRPEGLNNCAQIYPMPTAKIIFTN